MAKLNINDELIIKLLQRLGADRYVEKEGYIIFPTICHNEDSESASMKLYYYKDRKYFMCYTECGGMTVFKFLEHYYKSRGIEYDWYEDVYSLVFSCATVKTERTLVSQKKLGDVYNRREFGALPTYPNNILKVFTNFYTPEWLNDGITIEAMKKYDIKYSIPQNKIIIPHYNTEGKLIGIRGRALDPYEVEMFGKYMPVKLEEVWYKHPLSLNLYGLNISKEAIQKNGYCYVFESEKSCLQVEGFGIPNCSVAVCGSNFNKNQLKLLIKYAQPKEIIICFDKEEKQGEDKYFTKLWNMCERYSHYCNFSFIYDRYNLLDNKDSPSDKGEEIFKQLLQRRTKVNESKVN